MMMKSIQLGARARKVARACVPHHHEDMDAMRKSLRHSYYSVKRELNMHEVEMITKPLFQDLSLEVTVMGNKVCIVIANAPQPAREFDTNFAVMDLVNEWGMHDKMRRFLIRSLTAANKHGVYKYKPGVAWKCPLDVYYVFDEDA